MTTSEDFPALEATITVAAEPAQVWEAVTDVRRIASWSPQVARTVVIGGEVKEGARFLNVNKQGWKRWPTTAKVVSFEPHRDFAFKVVENSVVWRFVLEPVEGGTKVTQTRDASDVSILSRVLIPVALGGPAAFTEETRAGMQQTLERLKAEVEG